MIPETKEKPFRKKHVKPQRNAVCPCGSGKKFKYCCEREFRNQMQNQIIKDNAEKSKVK
jgi:hypothetical protein